jgi:hypothetical protein
MAHSHMYKYNPSVTKLFSPKMTQQGRNMYEVFIVKIITFCALVGDYYFLCDIVHEYGAY